VAKVEKALLRSLAAIGLSVLVLAVTAVAASAGTVVNERPLLFTFDGDDSAAGRFEVGAGRPSSIAIDYSNGVVYVGAGEIGESRPGYVSKFDADGTAINFSTTGTSSLFGPGEALFPDRVAVAVDNSTANPSRLYVGSFGDGVLYAFDPTGSRVWSVSPATGPVEDVAVDPSGHPWAAGPSSPPVQYENTSDTPDPTGCTVPAQEPSAIDVDTDGNVYASVFGSVVKYLNIGTCSFTEEAFDPTANDVSVDQSIPGGHIFTTQTGSFAEYDANGALLGNFGSEYLSADGEELAYSPDRDWVYVIQQFEPRPVVAVFGPAASGTVPDVTAIDPPSAVGISSAHFEGTVNSLNVASTAHFEWKHPQESWAAADSSPAHTLVPNETPQTVEFDTKSLRGNSTYEVRLVTVNSGPDKLHAFLGEVKEFFTLSPPASPEVTIEPPSSITTTSASIHGTIDPQGDTADWRVQVSADPACLEGFSDRRLQRIEEGSDDPVDVAFALTGLLPSQHYCVRISALNGFGENLSTVEEFETEAAPPSEVELIAAAPREDTRARINAKVNPNGDILAYRFEYSADGGDTWIPLPAQEETSEAREAIVIGQELESLEPGTTYRYRLALLQNGGGQAGSLGGEREFTTRAADPDPSSCPNASIRSVQGSQYLHHCRAFELVNNADKGAQNALLGETSRDGEHALWVIPGGAPGSPSGTSSTFRADRTPGGWLSEPIAPPAAQQLGGGTWNYLVEATTADFSTIIAAPSDRNSEESALVRLDSARGQKVLRLFPNEDRSVPFKGGDVSDDAAHVLFINGELEPAQIEEIGGGEPAEVVSLMPDGTPSECGMSTNGEGDNFTGRSGDGRGAGRDWRPGYHRISTVDASRLFFQVQPNGDCGSSSLALYQRNRQAGETTLIDPGTGSHEPHFIRAAPDGRVGYFGTASGLDPVDENQHEDVYRWEEGGEVTCLTCEATPDADLDPNSPIMVSDDLSSAYFTSRSRLAPPATAGHRNIYVLRDGAIRFVADLPPGSNEESGLVSPRAQLSADGRVLLFPSTPGRTLTADTVSAEVELYRYDDADGSLECVSCRRGGATASKAEVAFGMSSDGSTAVFATEEPLTASDVNEGNDVYEWRNGKVSLITDGQSTGARPEAGGVSDDGRDIFFSVVQPGLTGFERDGLRNVYDARIGGGFEPPTPPVRCDGDSCQGPLQAAPPVESPASEIFRQREHRVKPGGPRCHKGKVRRHGRCVRRHRHRHKANAGHRRGQ
jgi:hypothetical protein